MRKWQIGDVTVTKIVEIESVGGATWIIPDATREAVRDIEWLKPEFMNEEGELKFSVHALVVDTPSQRIVVDTCVGNEKERMPFKDWHQLQTTFLEDFEAAGFPLDAAEADATRRRVFDEHAETPTLVIGTHFAGVTAGRVVRDGDAYRLEV